MRVSLKRFILRHLHNIKQQKYKFIAPRNPEGYAAFKVSLAERAAAHKRIVR